MIRINKDIAKDVIASLKAEAYPAYTNWVDYVNPGSLSSSNYLILYSGEMRVNSFFKKEEFYFLKNILKEKNPLLYSIVFHSPTGEKPRTAFSPKVEEEYAEVAFVKQPVLEPAGIGEIVFQSQTTRLDQDNQISILEFLDLSLPVKIKDIFLFKINEFAKNGEQK